MSRVTIQDAYGPVVSIAPSLPNEIFFCQIDDREYTFMLSEQGLTDLRDEDNARDLPLDGEIAAIVIEELKYYT